MNRTSTVSSPAGTPGGLPLGMPTPAVADNLFAADKTTALDDHAGLTSSGSESMLRRMAAISRWRDQYDPLRGFDLRRAVYLSEDFPRGWYADLQWTYFFLEWTDPDLFALVDRRTSRLLEMDYTVKVRKDADETLGKEQAACLQEFFERIDNMDEVIEHLAMASFRGFAHAEKWYNDAGDLEHFEIVDQWNVIRDGLKGGWKYNPRSWQTGYFGLPDENIIDPSRFIIREQRRHINRIALLKFVSKKLGEVDWDAFLEIYGIPSGVVVGPPNVPDAMKAAFEIAAAEIARGGSGFLPHGSIYNKNDMPRGGAPFKERLEYLTEKLILVGTGGMLTMLSRSGSGTLAGNAHQEVFEQIAKAESKKISAVLNRSAAEEELKKKFPGKKMVAYFELASNEETKVGEVVDHIVKLKTSGYQVDPEEVSERTGYTVTLAAPTQDSNDPDAGLDGNGSDPATGDPANVQNRRKKIRNSNRPAVDSNSAVFQRNAARKLSAAEKDALQPLLDRVAALKDGSDEDFAAGLKKLRDDLPRLFAEARLQVPDIANVWEQVLGTALVDGLADVPSVK